MRYSLNFKTIAIALLNAIGIITLAVTPLVAQTIPAELLNNIQRQVEDLLQSTRVEDQPREANLSQLSRAGELAQTISEVEIRDRLLRSIGQAFVELEALKDAEAIAQAMNYKSGGYDYSSGSRAELEQAIIKAYAQSGQAAQALSVAENAPPTIGDQYWLIAIETLAMQGNIAEATTLFSRISDSVYSYPWALRSVTRAYIGAEQFSAAQTLWQQSLFAEDLARIPDFAEIAVWAGRAGELETARAIADQIPANYRAGTLIKLAQISQYQGQSALAKPLLDESRSLLAGTNAGTDKNGQRSFTTATELAEAYAGLGEAEAARNVLIAAEQAGAVSPEAQPNPTGNFASDWVGAFAKIGAFDRATQLLDSTSAGQRHAARLSLATVYIDRGQYDLAITTLRQIPDSALLPYLADRQELFERIVKAALAQENVNTAKQVAQVIKNPADSVSVWLKIAAFYREQREPEYAIDILDRTLAMVEPLKKFNSPTRFNASFELPNAEPLIAIAKEYWALGQREQAIETAEWAIASIQNFPFDSSAPSYSKNDLGAIAKLGRDWQVPELQAAAVREMETLIEASASDEQNSLNTFYRYDLISLVKLAYNPNQAPSELFNRNLARLETILEQTPKELRLDVLEGLAPLYSAIDRPEAALTAFEELLPLIEALPAQDQGFHYARLARTTVQNADLEAQVKVLPRLSTGQYSEVLTEIIQQAAADDDIARTMKYFDRLMELSVGGASPVENRTQSQDDRDQQLFYLASLFEEHGVFEILQPKPPRTPATVALLMRLPQQISDPTLRVQVLTTLVLDLPPAETAAAYEAISATLQELPDGYDKRSLIWSLIEAALRNRAFEPATQMAYQLEGEYCQTALGWIKANGGE